MTFEYDGMKVTQPLYPYQGPRYTKVADDNMEVDVIDQLYALTARKRVYYINPIVNGLVSWISIQSMDGDFKVEFNDWKQGRFEKILRCCSTFKSVKWIGT